MATIEHKGKSYEVDEDGFLLKGAEEWDENWVDYVKSVEGIADITDEHQKVIDALQEYYKKNGIAPMVRILSKTTGFPLKRIYELFPSGPGKGACKMAGLPEIHGRQPNQLSEVRRKTRFPIDGDPTAAIASGHDAASNYYHACAGYSYGMEVPGVRELRHEIRSFQPHVRRRVSLQRLWRNGAQCLLTILAPERGRGLCN